MKQNLSNTSLNNDDNSKKLTEIPKYFNQLNENINFIIDKLKKLW